METENQELGTENYSPPPSPAACELLAYLRSSAHRPDLAKTDAVIAAALELPERSIVDLADELLQAGHLVVARVVAPFGRWLLIPERADPAAWDEARAHVASLHDRGVKVLARQQHAASALRRSEARRPDPLPPGGQGQLFAPAGATWATR